MAGTTTRLLVTCGALLALALVLGIVGFFAGMPIVEWKMRAIGATQVVLASPREARGVQIATLMMFAWPPIAAIIAVAIHRWRRRADASPLVVLAYFAIPAAALSGYVLLRTQMTSEIATGGMQPMLSPSAFGPGTDEARIVGFVSICLWIFIATRKPAKF